jgi:nucleotide-binding universal stress UspA family protein
MYKHILVPVDLVHVDALDKAIATAARLAQLFDSSLTFVGVTAATPTPVAHNPQEFQQKLEAFAAAQADTYGVRAAGKGYTAHDPAVQIDETLLQAVDDVGADLIVMASHVPNVADAILPSHGGKLATHAAVSVFIVR